MNRFRFSMGSFLVVITLLVLGLGAIASQSAAAASLAYTAFLSLLCLAAAVAAAPQSPRRAFCAGFAIFGFISLLSGYKSNNGNWLRQEGSGNVTIWRENA